MMRIIHCTLALGLSLCLSSALAQPRLSVGVSGGIPFIPSLDDASPIIGGSTWFHAANSVWLSGEYLLNEGCDWYPNPPPGFLVLPNNDESRTQRLAVGLHFPFTIKNVSPVNLVGINFGHSWDHCNYRLFETPVEPPYPTTTGTDDIQRSVLYASLTAMSRNKHVPFFLQVRGGLSFDRISSFSFVDSEGFIHVIAGVHLGIF
jgi:hypothetical protein